MERHELKELYDKVVEIVGDGGLYKPQILINEHNMTIKIDSGTVVKRMSELDEYIKGEGYIKAQNGMLHIVYHLPSIAPEDK